MRLIRTFVVAFLFLLAFSVPTAAGEITGTVQRADGRPIPYALVLGVAYDASANWLRRQTMKGRVCRSTTDGQGRFRLAPPLGLNHIGGVSIFAEKFAIGRFPIRRSDGTFSPLGERLQVVLTPEVRLPVRVVNRAGVGLAGVHVYTGYEDFWRPGQVDEYAKALSAQMVAPTNERGETQVTHLPPTGRYGLQVQDTAWVETVTEMPDRPPHLADAPTPQIIMVEPAATISGRLLAGEGRRPLPACRIWLQSQATTVTSEMVVTDRHGLFRIGGLRADTYIVNAIIEPAPGFLTAPAPPVTLHTGEHRQNFDIHSPSGGLITGRVIDGKSGKPLKSASIETSSGGDMVYPIAETDAKGVFRFRVKPKDWSFSILPPRPYERSALAGRRSFFRVNVQNGQEYNQGDLRQFLDPLRTVHGRVLAPNGQPVPQATVFYATESDFGFGGPQPKTLLELPSVQTGNDGTFTISSLLARKSVAISARKGDWGTRQDTQIRFYGRQGKTETGNQTLRLAYTPLATVRGRVLDDQGVPVASASIDIRKPQEFSSWTTSPSSGVPHTDAQGRFQIRLEPGGTYFLYASDAKGGRAISAAVTPPPGGWLLVPALVLRLHDTGLSIQVIDGQGRSIPNAHVAMTLPENFPPFAQRYQLIADRNGRMTREGLTPGQYAVQVSAPDGSHVTDAIVDTAAGNTVLMLR